LQQKLKRCFGYSVFVNNSKYDCGCWTDFSKMQVKGQCVTGSGHNETEYNSLKVQFRTTYIKCFIKNNPVL